MAPARAPATPVAASAGGPEPSAPSHQPSGPAPLPAISSTPTATSLTTSRRSATSRTRSTVAHRLGAGLVEIPSIPARDPADAVMADPMVPENRRFCATCDEPVGRSRDGTPGRAAGFCRKCGSPFSFEPKLAPGVLVAKQYEVVGCLAHGGMGWVYLARDRNVSDRWVVLKGLLNADDRDATAAALAERRFLAEVEHPNIVKIFNFVEHEGLGYIVMEYVGGQSLKQILTARRDENGGESDPLRPDQAIAYVLEILPALGYLHDLGLLFCDFKVDNVIQTRHSLKLIDLGGVYRLDEPTSALFGTTGYQAPEIATLGPSIPSDLFTVARTLAVLCIDFRGYQSTYRYTLPPQESVPALQRYDSLYRFLLKGTAPNPDDRFQSAEEMADQLFGVLREVVADREGIPVPAPSKLFTAPMRAGLERPDWRILPRPQVSSDDPSAGYLATITAADSAQLIAQLRAAPDRTVEVDLRLAAAMIDDGSLGEAEAQLAEIEAQDPWEWRVAWYRGIAALAEAHPDQARASFERVYHAVPGELAPKLALGLACEFGRVPGSDMAAAGRWYEIVARTDPSITSASFGLARCRLQAGDRAGALAAYELVPDTSSGYIDAQTARIRCLSRDGEGEPGLEELLAAGSALEALPVEGEQRERLTADLLESALRMTLSGRASDDGEVRLLGLPLVERDVRLALEHSYRELARHAPSRAERIALVDDANRVRPRTWI
ncbi:MAG: tetratricopeptide repeat protein [Solirubrobacteraceae bacterium]